jgi:hypothetical protein
MVEVVIYMGQWHTSTTIPRPFAGDTIRHRGKLMPVKAVTLRSGSPIVEVSVDETHAYSEWDMHNDGWEFTPNAPAHGQPDAKREAVP